MGRTPNPKEEWIVIDDAVPAIITKEEWKRAESHRYGHRTSSGITKQMEPYILSGIAYCHCGRIMWGTRMTNGKGAKHQYYRCSGNETKECDAKYIGKHLLEDAVISTIKNELVDGRDNWVEMVTNAYKELVVGRGDKKKELDKRGKEIDNKISKIVDAIEIGMYDPSMKERMAEYREQRDSIDREILLLDKSDGWSMPSRMEILTQIDTILDDLDDFDMRRKAIKATTTRVTVYPDKVRVDHQFGSQVGLVAEGRKTTQSIQLSMPWVDVTLHRHLRLASAVL
jgi:hypothetical protein